MWLNLVPPDGIQPVNSAMGIQPWSMLVFRALVEGPVAHGGRELD